MGIQMENDFEIDALQTAQNELAVTKQVVRNSSEIMNPRSLKDHWT